MTNLQPLTRYMIVGIVIEVLLVIAVVLSFTRPMCVMP